MDDVAHAIADPVRRDILLMLRSGALTVGEIAGRFTVSRPAVSRHLRVLRECGLVHDELVGRHRVYELSPEPLAGLAEWIAMIRGPSGWDQRLDALETEVHRTRRERAVRRTASDNESREDTA
ncbi:metalloregulator ArsR/SmtB family transcription factor [Streptomyces sp. Qhu-G9]|uniref:ArsR/SmtB family transcription factor n=1 Tax=Streptomyces sp. Qhu-G9 TaxID=3452799 RepID=UPI0022AC70AE|nr:metalloregulator ArsR/SmtB family transcription factor [Streptomyces aurantiacus]WAU82905.1 metalloregulator ArsR/SmtB family transcription factor [Streptomyces aurantiacus]